LLESVYEACLKKELVNRGLDVRAQVEMPVVYEGERIDLGFRVDLLVEDQVIVEVKAVERLLEVHKAQLLSYLKLTDKRIGLLINFKVPRLKDGITRMVNNL
jgi:GxxExxY protein